MSTFRIGAIACKNGEPRTNNLTGISRNQWQKGWDWEYFNSSGDKPAGTVDRASVRLRPSELRKDAAQ